MRNRDWSLVCFTILSQWSVGIILCFTLLGFVNNETTLVGVTGLSLHNPVLLALVLMTVATGVSFMHLGSPSNAANALNNLSGSWLSREILAIGVYSLSLLPVFVLGWKNGNIEHLEYILLPACVFGLALLWVMIRIYVIPTIPAWNRWHTPLSFVASALCLGLLTVGFYYGNGFVTISEQIADTFTACLILVLLIEIASGFIHQYQLEKMDTGIDDIEFDRGVFKQVFLFRMAMLITALMLIVFNLAEPGLYQGISTIYPIMILIITGECLGRLLFYSSYFRVGV